MSDIYLRGFEGINNINNAQNLKSSELVDALNVDITNMGNIKTRPSWKYVKNYTDAHSLFATFTNLYLINEDNLIKLDKNLNEEIIDIGYKGLKTSFTEFNKNLIISNERFIKRFKNGNIYNLVPETYINTFNVTLDNNGNFLKGIYKVAISFLHEDGMEGATSTPISINVENDNTKIILSNLASTNDFNINKIRVYISRINGETLFRYDDFNVSTDTIELIYNVNQLGQQLDSINNNPLKNGNIIRKFNSYLITAFENKLFITKPLQFLTDYNYIEFDEEITMLETIETASGGSGIYVSDKKHCYFLSGDMSMLNREVLDCQPAIKNSSCKSPYTNELFWFTQRGQIVGMPGGKIENLTDSKFLPDNELLEGNSFVMLHDGRRKIINTFKKGQSSSAGMGDWAKIVD